MFKKNRDIIPKYASKGAELNDCNKMILPGVGGVLIIDKDN